LPKDISKIHYSNKRTFASLVTEQLDTLSNLSKLTFTSNLSQEVIARELSNIIRIISVNLEYGNSPISSLREINELVLEINTFLEKSFDQGLISNEILEKNRLSLCRTLSSCNRLPSEFIRDLVSHLSG
jgi:vacuolar-type H+-ATPase subunit I/STV1